MRRVLALLFVFACALIAFDFGPVKARPIRNAAAAVVASPQAVAAVSALPAGPPTMTAEPTTPATVQLEESDRYADGIGMTTTMSVKSKGDSGYFSQVAPFFCGNFAAQNGTLTPTKSEYQCIRHLRNGLWSENTPTARADTNILAVKFGVDSFQIINPGDTDASIIAAKFLYAQSDGVGMSNEIDANNYGESIRDNTNIGDTMITLANCCSQPPFPGSNVVLEPGAPSYEVVAIQTSIGYTGGSSNQQGTIMHVVGKCAADGSPGSGMCKTHTGNAGVSTKLGATIAGLITATGVPTTPYPTTTSPVPVPQTLPTFPASPAPNTMTTQIPVESTSGFAVNEYVTLDCGSVNSGHNTASETVRIKSITGNMLTLYNTPNYAHAKGADVRAGCIQVAPTNGFWGAITYGPNQLTQLQADLSGFAPILATAVSSPINANAFSPYYGGTQITSAEQAAIFAGQVHYCSGLNCGGSWGDGTTGEHGAAKVCFSYLCPTDSWQAAVASVQTIVNSSLTPWWCSECSWSILPVGATQTTSTLGNQFPEDEAVAFAGSIFYLLHHGASRFYWSAIADGDTFCDNGLLYMPGICTGDGFPWDNGVKVPTPKALYYTLTDLYGLFDDPQCKLPGCKFTPQSITWNWQGLPMKADHTHPEYFQGIDPSQVRSVQTEDSYGDFKMEFHYEAMHYLPGRDGNGGCSGYTSMNCYQFCGTTDMTGFNEQVSKLGLGSGVGGPTCLKATLTIQNAALKPCTLWDTDMNSTHTKTFGHLEPLSVVSFNASNQILLDIRPEPQVLVCAHALSAPTRTGANLNSPKPVTETATPDPIPTPAPAATTYPPNFQ